MAPKPWWFRTTSHSCRCRRAHRPRRPGKHLALHASGLVVEPDFQILRRYRRPLLATLGTHSSTNPGRLCPSRDATGQQWSLNSRIGISRFLLSLPELSSQDLNRPFRNLTPGRFPFVNSTPARVSTVSITARLSGSPAYRPTSILLIVFR